MRSNLSPLVPVVRDKPFEHSGSHGTTLRSTRCDLITGKDNPVILKRPAHLTDAQFAEDVAQIVGWWSANILEDMLKDGKGFSGFDCIRFKVVPVT